MSQVATFRRFAVTAAVALVVGAVPMLATAPPAGAAPSELFFSEYIEGSSNNKAIEIFNGTGAAINLAANGYAVQMYFNGSSTAGLTIALTGTVASGDVYVVAQASASPAVLAQADQTNGSGWFNGDDAVVLARAGVAVDVIGQIGVDPGTEWGTGLTSTADNTLRRKAAVTAGDTNGTDAFDPSVEWDGFAIDTFDGLGNGDIAPTVVNITPADGSADVGIATSVGVTFSEPVTLDDGWYTISCSSSGTHAATVSGGPTVFTIDPAVDFTSGESCTVTISAALVHDQDTADPPDNLAADVTSTFGALDLCSASFTPAYAIEGNGAKAAITGPVRTKGVVVGDYEGPSPTLRGFYLQDATGDGDPTTSDALFVFEGDADRVALGDVVVVSGTAAEFQDQTQVSANSVAICGTGATVAPVDVDLPFPSADFPERYEGMLVRLPQTLSVTEHFQLGRFGQVELSSGGRLPQPTSIAAPGAPAIAQQAANDLNRIIIDDALQNQNADPIVFGRNGQPLSAANTLRGGDTAKDTIGVMTYTWAGNAASGNAFRVRPIGALDGTVSFQAANPRPTTAPARTGTLRAASMNLLNFFNTFTGCTNGAGGAPTDCRGANSQVEFDRQWPKTVAAITGTQADVIGVIEMENDGYGPDSAIAFLVNKLNAATAPGTYAFIDVDAKTGQTNALGTDAIKVGLVYKPAAVTPVGQTAALNSEAFVNGGDGFPRNRPALAQAFQQPDGQRFVMVVNHLKSKGSACDAPDAGDGQGNCNAVRTNAANLLTAWLATDPTGTGDTDTLIVGDLNSYAEEDPITAIVAAGYTNLVKKFGGNEAYSYLFDGQWGYLDHALGSPSIVPQTTKVADWHINADEPTVLDYNTDFKSAGQIVSLYAPDQFRISDHDPVLVDLDLRYEQTPRVVAAFGTIRSPTAPRGFDRASFTLAASNRSGGRPPLGSVQFLSLGDGLLFAGTGVQYLVANTSFSAARLAGSGQLNGQGGYSYEVWLRDAAPDTFRIRITKGATVVYDSATQPVSGGAVVILR
jgi:predicted extracellular nuclease